MITPKDGFNLEDYRTILELLSIISWKLRLTPRPENEKKFRMALIAIKSVADSNAHNIFLKHIVDQLNDFLRLTATDEEFVSKAIDGQLIEKRLRDCREIMENRNDARMSKAFADFVYRFAFKLAGLTGRSFTGMGQNVGAEDAQILLLIKSELGG